MTVEKNQILIYHRYERLTADIVIPSLLCQGGLDTGRHVSVDVNRDGNTSERW